MSLLETELAVLCELRDYGAMSEADLAYAVSGAPDLLPGLCARGYVNARAVAERQTEWELTDGGLDVVDGDG